MFVKIIDYLEELKGDNENKISDLLEDYFISIYEAYKGFRVPTLINFSPSTTNRVNFEEFIYEFTEQNQEEYWYKEVSEPPEIIDIQDTQDNNFSPSFIEI